MTRVTSGNDNNNTRMTTNTKYSKPVISTNPSANVDKRKNRINNLMNNELVYNTQKKNKFSDNVNKIYGKENFNIISNKLLNSFEGNEKSLIQQQIKEENKKEKYKIRINEMNAQNNDDTTHMSLVPSSSTSLYNNIKNSGLGYNNMKKINDIITPDKKIMRSSSVGYFNLENSKQNNKRGKFIEYNSNKLLDKNGVNIISKLNNSNSGDYTNLYNIANKGEQSNLKLGHKSHILDNNLNSQRAKINNNNNYNENKIKNNLKLNNSKNTFYLPRLNHQKGANYNYNEYNYINNNINNKKKNKLNVSQLKFKINNAIKRGFNLNTNNKNKLLVFPQSNYQQIFKRSESSGFINLGSNINNNISNRGNKNPSNSKKFMGLSNSLVNMGYINNEDKKLKRNASELFL